MLTSLMGNAPNVEAQHMKANQLMIATIHLWYAKRVRPSHAMGVAR